MSILAPPRWSAEQLAVDAATAESHFRNARLAITNAWETHYLQARGKFELLFSELDDLSPSALTTERLAKIYGLGLGEALRYLAGPPVSDDDLQVIADVDSIAPSVLQRNPESLTKVFGVIERIIDAHRFPWVRSGSTPTPEQREAALLSSSVLLAAQRIATERRNDEKQSQEELVKAFLRSKGFTERPTETIRTLVNGPQAMEFCGECMLGDRKADIVVRLHDTRLMAIECKVSNSSTNSVKRLNNDAAAKAEVWIRQFGTQQVVPTAVLAGVFKVLNLTQAQTRGLTLFWSHDLAKLGEFIDSTVNGK